MVSVIIPTYNREKTILRAIESVLAQTVTDLELIVVDDCSTDSTREIVSSVRDGRLRYVCLEQNSGACVARNRGIEEAKGEYIAFQDSDDSWRPEKLERQLEAINRWDTQVCFCRSMRHNYSKDQDPVYPSIPAGVVGTEELIRSSIVSTQTILARREVFGKVMFDPVVRRRQDYDWVIRAAQEYSFCLCHDVLVDIFLQDDSITNLGAKKSVETFEYLMEKHSAIAEKFPSFRLSMLHNIGYYKTMAGMKATDESRQLSRLRGGIRSKVMYLLCRLGLLRTYFRMTS